jgi:hypothetical protein
MIKARISNLNTLFVLQADKTTHWSFEWRDSGKGCLEFF